MTSWLPRRQRDQNSTAGVQVELPRIAGDVGVTVEVLGSAEGQEIYPVDSLQRYVADNIRTFEQDFPIWENKVYRERPVLCDGDGPIHEFRRWAAQFLPTPD